MAETSTDDLPEATTQDHLEDALESLKNVDLRKLPKDMRQGIKDARTVVKTALKAL